MENGAFAPISIIFSNTWYFKGVKRGYHGEMVTCWERADLLPLVGGVYCIFVTFPCCILGQVWYLIVSFPDLCSLSYFKGKKLDLLGT